MALFKKPDGPNKVYACDNALLSFGVKPVCHPAVAIFTTYICPSCDKTHFEVQIIPHEGDGDPGARVTLNFTVDQKEAEIVSDLFLNPQPIAVSDLMMKEYRDE